MKLDEELQKLETFGEWLKRQDSHRTVGVARSTCDCPLATFVKEQIDSEESVVVGRNSVGIGDGIVHHTRLSYAFTRWIDDGRREGQPVSASEAITALRSAQKEVR